MAKNYLDQAGLTLLLQGLSTKLQKNYLAIGGTAVSAEKVVNKLTLNVGGSNVEFDGSAAKSADVAAAEHTHEAKDVTDFEGKVKSIVFGKEDANGTVQIHNHDNLDELKQIATGDVAKWNAMIKVGDAARLTYSNDNMSGVADVKTALDVLAANLVRTTGQLAIAGKAMQDVESKVDANAKAITDMKDVNVAGSLAKQIKDLQDANAEGGAVKEAIDQVAQDLADFEGEQATKEDAQDKAISDEAARADAEEKRIVGLVEAEATTARAAEQAALKAGQDAQADVDALEKRLDDEGGLVDRLEAAEAFVAAHDDTARDARIKTLEDAIKEGGAIKEAIDAAQADADNLEQRLDAEGGLVDRIEANEANIARLDGAVTVEGSVKKQIKDAIDEVNGAAEDLEERVKANEDAIGVINGTGEGSIKKAVADLVNGAPDALDTLDELAAALRDKADVLDAIETAFDGKLSQQKTDLQKEIDDDVKAEADLRVAADNALDARIKVIEGEGAGSVKKAQADAIAEATRLDGVLKQELQAEIDSDVKVVADELAKQKNASIEGTLAKQIADEKSRAEGVEAGFETRIAANEAFVAAQPAIDKAQDDRIKALEDANKDGGAVADAIDAAQKAADDAQGEIDALEKVVGDIAEGKTVAGLIGENAQAAADAAAAAATADGKAVAAQKDVDDLEAVVGKEKDGEVAATGIFARLDLMQAEIDKNESDIATIGVPITESEINAVLGTVFGE